MKNLIPSATIALFAIFCFSSCMKDDCESTQTFLEFRPVWVGKDVIDLGIQKQSPRDLEYPGKIYFYQNYILINEQYEGVHIIDNHDPSNPVNLSFISIPGNVDIAMKDQVLYADNYKDILQIDMQDPDNPTIINRIEDIKEPIYSEDFGGRYLIYYEPSENTVEVNCDEINFADEFFFRNGNALIDVAQGAPNGLLDAAAEASGGSGNEGLAGSMARFALFGNQFYFVDESRLHVYDVTDVRTPNFLNIVYLSWGIETIFPYKNNLFIGANNGMHIFDNTDPANPVYLSTFEHAQACDPVAVEGNTAYVTLRDGSECQNFINQLDVIDITNLVRPELIKSYPMYNPHGLSVRNQILYLADGDAGLKVYDVSDPLSINDNQLDEVKDYHGYDVISVSDQLLLFIGEDGFYQYDTSDPDDIRLLSHLPINKS